MQIETKGTQTVPLKVFNLFIDKDFLKKCFPKNIYRNLEKHYSKGFTIEDYIIDKLLLQAKGKKKRKKNISDMAKDPLKNQTYMSIEKDKLSLDFPSCYPMIKDKLIEMNLGDIIVEFEDILKKFIRKKNRYFNAFKRFKYKKKESN